MEWILPMAVAFLTFVIGWKIIVPGQEKAYVRGQEEQRRQLLEQRVQELEQEGKHRERVLQDALLRLSEAHGALQEERERIRARQEEAQQRILEERDRQWAQFEQGIVQYIGRWCEDERIALPWYSNTRLPLHMTGVIKPDVLIELGDRYVVLDAKMSKGGQPESYIKEQVKKTAKKYASMKELFPLIFFVVPDEQLLHMNDTVFHEGQHVFMVIGQRGIYGVLYLLKQVMLYGQVGELTGEERTALVSVLASMSQHMDAQRAVHTIMDERGVEVQGQLQLLPANMQEEVQQHKKQLRLVVPTGATVRQVMGDL